MYPHEFAGERKWTSIFDRQASVPIDLTEKEMTANQTQVGALRFNEGKPELNYLLTFPKAIYEFAKVCMYGSKKYDRGNYLKGGKPVSEYVDCLLRHLSAWQNGEDIDPESGCHHLGHVVWNALAACQFTLSGNCIDDRINEDKFK